MADHSKIEWTDTTWQPTSGCDRISPGCGDGSIDGARASGGGCYAERLAHKLGANPATPQYRGLTRMTEHGPRWTGEVHLNRAALAAPLGWRAPRRVFVDSMADLFHERVPDRYIAAVFGVMAAAKQHTFQVLTKRAERMCRWFEWVARETGGQHAPDAAFLIGTEATNAGVEQVDPLAGGPWPLPNVWLGVSCESQEWADRRIPHLLATPARVRFISAEPLLGPIDLRSSLRGADSLSGPLEQPHVERGPVRIHQVIAGSESGLRPRAMHEDWVRSLRDQCTAAGVSFFYKQRLERGRKVSLPLLDDRQWAEFPEVHHAR